MSRQVTLSGILPQPDARSWAIYLVLAVMIPSTWLGLALADIRFGGSWDWTFSEVALVLIFVAWMLRRAGHWATSAALETIGLMAILAMAGVVLQYPLMSLPLPFTDRLLLDLDRALGFDWWAFARLFNHPTLWATIAVAYTSMIFQTFALLVLLCATRREIRAWQFVTAASLALVATLIVFPFFPADGSLILCSLAPGDPWVSKGVCDYGPLIHHLKAGQVKVLEQSMRLGLVSFPSFHTAIALQFAWGFWPYAWLRWPAAILNILLVCGAIVVASHYFIDVLAGGLLGLLAINIAKRLITSEAPRRLRGPAGLRTGQDV